MKRITLHILIGLAGALTLIAVGCDATALPADETVESVNLQEVTLMLDWVPNVNHTGLFVAEELGYFAEAGLDVEIIQPGEVLVEAAIVSGAADFGVSFQEYVTLSRADDVSIVSIAAVIQHNTSGFAALSSTPLGSPADFEGLRYGSYGSPFEQPTLRVLMECYDADFSAVEVIETGFADPLALLAEEQIDLAWIFYGTQGIAAQQKGIDLNLVMLEDHFDCIPDYYTPVLIASEATISERPEVVRAFVTAASRGYRYAIDNPAASADILLTQTPESGQGLLRASQEWLSPRYQAGAQRWGEQDPSVWDNYYRWMIDNGILQEPIDIEAAFTNQFLP